MYFTEICLMLMVAVVVGVTSVESGLLSGLPR